MLYLACWNSQESLNTIFILSICTEFKKKYVQVLFVRQEPFWQNYFCFLPLLPLPIKQNTSPLVAVRPFWRDAHKALANRSVKPGPLLTYHTIIYVKPLYFLKPCLLPDPTSVEVTKLQGSSKPCHNAALREHLSCALAELEMLRKKPLSKTSFSIQPLTEPPQIKAKLIEYSSGMFPITSHVL